MIDTSGDGREEQTTMMMLFQELDRNNNNYDTNQPQGLKY